MENERNKGISMRYLDIHVTTDDDFSINGQGFYDRGYNGTFPMEDGEEILDAYRRWLDSILIEGKAWARDWLKAPLTGDFSAYSGDDYITIPGGNWSLDANIMEQGGYEDKPFHELLQEFLAEHGYTVSNKRLFKFVNEKIEKV